MRQTDAQRLASRRMSNKAAEKSPETLVEQTARTPEEAAKLLQEQERAKARSASAAGGWAPVFPFLPQRRRRAPLFSTSSREALCSPLFFVHPRNAFHVPAGRARSHDGQASPGPLSLGELWRRRRQDAAYVVAEAVLGRLQVRIPDSRREILCSRQRGAYVSDRYSPALFRLSVWPFPLPSTVERSCGSLRVRIRFIIRRL